MAGGGGTSGGAPATHAQYSAAELTCVVDVAHRAGRGVVAHCRAPSAIRAAIGFGVDRIEHLTWEVPGGVAFDARAAHELGRRGIWADPT